MAENLENVLSWLDNSTPAENRPQEMPAERAKQGGTIDNTRQKENAPAGALEGLGELQRKIDVRQAEKAALAAIFTQHSENTKATGKLQTDILKGIEAGENIYKLFLMAARALSMTIGNPGFYSMVENNIIAIYGGGLNEPGALDLEREQASARLERLTAAEAQADNEDDRQRIRKAIIRHRQRIQELEEAINKTRSPA